MMDNNKYKNVERDDFTVFHKENVGQIISKELSEYIRTYIDKHDLAKVSIDLGISFSTLRDVTHRTNRVTENNAAGIIELIKIAKAKCSERIDHAKKASEVFNHNIHA